MILIQKIKCWFNRHELWEVERLSFSSQKLYCSSCKNYFAINHDVRVFLPWDESSEELYRFIKDFDKRLEDKRT